MADYDSYALPDVATEQDYARQLEEAQLADRRRQQVSGQAEQKRQRRLSQLDRQRKTGGAVEESATGQAQAVARQAYIRVWQYAEEGVQDFALSFADLMLLSGPATLMIFLIRFIGGNIFGGAGTITFREISVPRIPGYSVPEGTYKAGKILLIGLITGLLYALILLVVIALANPLLILQIGLCSVFGPIVSLFGSSVCSG